MGVLRFSCPPSKFSDALIRQAYVTSYHRTPLPVRVVRESERVFRVDKDIDLSVSLHVPWSVERHGTQILATSTLADREAPYHLPTELVRGALAGLRNQTSEWRDYGLHLSNKTEADLTEAFRLFREALSAANATPPSLPNELDALAETALEAVFDATRHVADAYTEQAFNARRRATDKFPVDLGAILQDDLPDHIRDRHFDETFNTAVVPISWRRIEPEPGRFDWTSIETMMRWTAGRPIKRIAGPVVSFDPAMLPNHALAMVEDEDAFAEAACRFASLIVGRYIDCFDAWIAAGRFNTRRVPNLSTDARVHAIERLIEQFLMAPIKQPWMLEIDQPWGEYLLTTDEPRGPIHWADALIQAVGAFGGLVLNTNIGHHPHATFPRPPLPFLRTLDMWSGLGVPLYIALSAPSDTSLDPNARPHDALDGGDWSPRAQQEWVHRYISLLLTKPYIGGVFWSQLSDGLPHEFPHAGLFDQQHRPKPAFKKLAALRKAFVQ